MKRFKIVLVTFILLIAFGSVVCAAGSMNFESVMKDNQLTGAAEKEELINLSTKMENGVVQEVKLLGNDAADSTDKDSMYKVYEIKSLNAFIELDESSSFKSIISSEYFWEVPVVDNENNIISSYTARRGRSLDDVQKTGIELTESQIDRVKTMEGKWDITLVGNYMPIEGMALINNKLEFENLLVNNGISALEEIKVVNFVLNTYVIYIRDKLNEYVIVYNMRPEFINMENGKIYEMSAFIDNFQTIIEKQAESGEGQYSGAGIESNEGNYFWLYISIGLVLLTIGGILFILKKKKPSFTI